MTGQIHFLGLVGPDQDLDLLPFWAMHYRSFSFDKYTAWIDVNSDVEAISKALLILRGHDFDTRFIDEPYMSCVGKRVKAFGNYVAALPKSTMVVTADVDEFQIIDPAEYHDLLRTYPVVKGRLIDRYDSFIHRAEPEIALSSQYPIRGNINDALDQQFPQRPSRHTIPRHDRKICAAIADIPVSYEGSHFVYKDEIDFQEKIEIDHYCWRDMNMISRKKYYTEFAKRAIAGFFHEEYCPPADTSALLRGDRIANETFPDNGPVDEVIDYLLAGGK